MAEAWEREGPRLRQAAKRARDKAGVKERNRLFDRTGFDTSWHKDAACRGLDTALFFPEGAGLDNAAARKVCEGCPVRRQCEAYAIEAREEHGTWAGPSENELHRKRREASRARRFPA